MNRVYDTDENERYAQTITEPKKGGYSTNSSVGSDDSHNTILDGLKAHETADLNQMGAGSRNGVHKSRAEKQEQEQLDQKNKEAKDLSDDNNNWNTNLSKGRRRFKITWRKLLVGGTTGLAAGGTIGIMFFSGPTLEFIHLAQFFRNLHFGNNENAADTRTSRLIRYAMGQNIEDTRLGYTMNKFAKRWENRMAQKSGIRPVYHEKTGRFIGYEIVDEEKAKPLLDDMKKEGVPIDDHVPSDGRAAKGAPDLGDGKFINVRDSSFHTKRSVIRSAIKSTGTGKISGSIISRTLIKRAGVDFHPLKNIRRKATDNIVDFRKKYREERAKRDKDGVKPPNSANLQTPDGEDGQELTDAEKAAHQAGQEATEAGQEATEEARQNVEQAKGENKQRFSGTKKFVAGAAAIAGILCSARGVSENVDKIQHANVVLPLTRVGFRMMAVGNQIMQGTDVSLDELGALHADLNDPEVGSWMQAKSIQAELGRKDKDGRIPGIDIPPTAKPGVNEKPQFIQIIDSIFEKAGAVGDTVCNPVVQFLTSVATNLTPASLITNIVTTAASSAASAAGINPVDMLVEWVTEKLAGEEVDVKNARGPELGNYINYGLRLAANNQAIAMGGRKLTKAEVAQLDAYRKSDLQEDLKEKSYFARMFDIKDVNSVVGQIMLRNPEITQPKTAIASVLRKPFGIFGSLKNNLAAAITPKTFAQATANYDYGFDEYGYSLSELQDEKFEDPFANAAEVEPRLDKLNEKYGKCFGTTVKNNRLTISEQPRYDLIEKGKKDGGFDYGTCKSATDKCINSPDSNECEEFTRYRFYIMDTLVEHSLACYEGEDNSCSQIGFHPGSDSSSKSNTSSIKGLESPPNLGPEAGNGYYQMPDAPNGEYIFSGGTPPEQRYGSKALIDVIYTVAKRWHAKYPQNRLVIGDLNARFGHQSHKTGVDVDITTEGLVAADTSGDAEKSKELAHMFADTGIIKVILYNDTSVQADFKSYVQQNSLSGDMQSYPGHNNHFHVRIIDEYKLAEGGQP